MHHHHHNPHHHHHVGVDDGTSHGPHAHDFAQANKDYFNDDFAKQYDARLEPLETSQIVAQIMLKAYPFSEDSTTVMDYACGTGHISRALAPHTKSIVGVDISQAMVDQYNLRVSNQGITSDEMKAVCTTLRGQEGELDDAKFDVVVCASSFHHFESIEDVTRTLAFFLKPGGSLLVADMAKMDSGEHIWPSDTTHIVPHRHGFAEQDIQKAFVGAGLELASFQLVGKVKMAGNVTDYFLVKGIKPLNS